jgi:alpha-amylase
MREKCSDGATWNQRSRHRGAGLIGALALAFALAVPAAAGAATPSPADWRDVVIYQVITDRFANGNPANDAVEGSYAPADGARIHGGDFAGIEQKLDYLVHLGVGAIWISPVVLNANAEYHGYAARDWYAIAPHFGTLAELQSMVAAAHARGIYVIMDVVVNHMGDLIDSGAGGYPNYQYPATYPLRWRNAAKRYFGVFDDLTKFHAHGNIGTYSDPEQIVGELFGLDDLKTEDAAVRAELVSAANWLITNTDCDGFRIDTVKHTEMGFWPEWTPAVRAHAASLGKSSFFMFGEVFDGSDAKNGSYTGTVGGGPYKLDSVLHYPMYYSANDVFAFDAATGNLPARYLALPQYDPTSRERLVTFLDNHDNSRFLGFGYANQDAGRLRTALGWLLTSRGVPCLYYGTEQEFDGGGDPWCREDMWDGAWDFGPSQGDNFDLTHPSFRFTRSLLELRARKEALRRGATLEHQWTTSGPGLYVFQRTTPADTALVVLNTANAPENDGGLVAPWPAGTPVVDALDSTHVATVSGGVVPARVAARGVQVFESLASWRAGRASARLHVESTFPGHDQNLNDRWSPLRVTFDRDLDPAGLPGAFTIAPATYGAWQVEGRAATFFPAAPWTAGATYAWSLDTTLVSTDGRRLRARFDASFRTTGGATGIAVAAGYAADRIARQGLAAPETIVPAPWLGEDVLLVGDPGHDRLFTLTPGGDLGYWVGYGAWSRVEGLGRSPSGAVTALEPASAWTIDARRVTEPAFFANTSGAMAWGSPVFASRLYVGDPANNRVAYVSGGSMATFANGISGAEGLAFGPGAPWSTDLYVSDANLGAVFPASNGQGRIVRVTPAGAVSNVVVNASLLGAGALAFDTHGAFGGHLFVADVLNERVLQITPAGAITVFATGFNNLSGSQCLAFGPDGALYVADAGSAQPFSDDGIEPFEPPQVIRIARAQLTVDAPVISPGAPALELAAPWPNPASGEVTLRFALAAPGRARLAVYDVSGRVVRDLGAETLHAGAHVRAWDGRDASGRLAGSGVYWVRLEAASGAVQRRVAVVR